MLLSVVWVVPGWPFYIGLAVLMVLLGCSAFASSAESAFFSLTADDVETLVQTQDRSVTSRLILRLRAEPDNFLATILVANNFVNVAVVILADFVLRQVVSFEQTPALGFFVNSVVITFLLLLFGEIMPKIFGTNYALTVARLESRPIYGLHVVLRPLSWVMSRSMAYVGPRMPRKSSISLDELGRALEITEGHLPEEEQILQGIVHFGDKEAYEVMTPRIDVVALDTALGFDAVKQVIMESGFSRIPVYKESFDNLEGVLYVKDILRYMGEGDSFAWQSILRKAYYVPENKPIGDLLVDFQRQSIHLAVVVDEYGGTCGIITLEDVLEEIFGEIEDESDEEEKLYTKLNEKTYIFEGKTQLNDFLRIVGAPEDLFAGVEGEAESLAGLVLEVLGRIPKVGERLEVKGIKLRIEAVSARRIETIRVEL